MDGATDFRASQYRAEQLGAKFPPLMVAAERVATTVAQGVHGRRRVGQGESFWQFRRYEPGDQTSRIDWRQSAKSRYVFVRETEWEAAQSVWLWRDASASMDYSSSRHQPTKRERADLLLLALAALLMRGGERFAVLGSGIPPATGRAAFSRLAAAMLGSGVPVETETRDKHGTASTASPSLPLFEPLPRYAQTVLFGDFLVPLEEFQRSILAFAGRGVRGFLVQILDPAEEHLPFRGRIRFSGFEGEDQTLLSRVEAVRHAYRDRVENHRAGLASIARRAGWGFTTYRTDQPPEAALLTLFLALTPQFGF